MQYVAGLFVVASACLLAVQGSAFRGEYGCCRSAENALPSCLCLPDNVALFEQWLPPGGLQTYYWKITEFAAIDVPDSLRPPIAFRLYDPLKDGTKYFKSVISVGSAQDTRKCLTSSWRTCTLPVPRLHLLTSYYYSTGTTCS